MRRGLVKKPIIDKRGRRTTVWVKPSKGKITEEAQQYIDIISLNPDLPRYQKYKTVLKDKFGINYDELDKDKQHLQNIDLSKLKGKSDFMNFDNYQQYAGEVFKKRGIPLFNHIDKMVSYEEVKELGDRLGFNVQLKEYDGGQGHYASHDIVDTITVPSKVDVNTLIHEMGHHFDHAYSKGYEGEAKKITNAISSYQVAMSNEVFAENFMHYFIAPEGLKKHLPRVYNELDERIPEEWKSEINSLMRSEGNSEQNLKKFLEGSHVKDVVYHGSNTDIKEFKVMDGIRGNAFLGAQTVKSPTHYFTDNKDLADKAARVRAENYGGRATIIEANISLKNPLDFSEMTYEAEEAFREIVGVLPHEHFGYLDNLDQWWQLFDEQKFVDKARSMGYDGVILAEEVSEDNPDKATVRSFGVFSSNQIRVK